MAHLPEASLITRWCGPTIYTAGHHAVQARDGPNVPAITRDSEPRGPKDRTPSRKDEPDESSSRSSVGRMFRNSRPCRWGRFETGLEPPPSAGRHWSPYWRDPQPMALPLECDPMYLGRRGE